MAAPAQTLLRSLVKLVGPGTSIFGSCGQPLAKLATEPSSAEGKTEKNIYYWEPKSLRIRAINWWHVFLSVYVYHLYNMAICLLALAVMWNVRRGTAHMTLVWMLIQDPGVLQAVSAAVLIIAYIMQRKPPVYCLDNTVFVPPQSWKVSHDEIKAVMKAHGCFNEDSLGFMSRLLANSGTGPATNWPPCFHPCRDGVTPAEISIAAARSEAEAVVFPIVSRLLDKSGVSPHDIDFLIVNCSLFSPTPSLCAMISNKFKFRMDIKTYNLGGMGCSANVISVDLAKELLQNRPGTLALVVSTENLTQNFYHGDEKSMLLQNTLFRAGGCALLLSSRRNDALRSKYKLLYTCRSQMSDDNSFNCVIQREDSSGNAGVALSKDIVTVAGQAMKHNFVALAPYILPIREQVRVLVNRCWIQIVRWAKKVEIPGASACQSPKAYMPDFTKGIDHFCIHAGGRAVIEGVQKNLGLQERHVMASKQTLHDWGNTSSSSIWYEVEWIERFGNLRRGDRVLQIAFGSGFKCNSAVWVTLRTDDAKIGVPLRTEQGQAHLNDTDAMGVVDKAL